MGFTLDCEMMLFLDAEYLAEGGVRHKYDSILDQLRRYASDCDLARRSLPRPEDWPYLPTLEHPWYGQGTVSITGKQRRPEPIGASFR